MTAIIALALSVIAAASPERGYGPWEVVFDGGTTDGTVTSVWAVGARDWFAAGRWGVARSTPTGVERTANKGRGVLGLWGQTPSSVYAFGYDETVLHFDGHEWAKEHMGATQSRRPKKGADLLYSAFTSETVPGAPIVAFGMSLVLVKDGASSWKVPTEPERAKLLDLGQGGRRDFALPPGCDRAGWFWLGKDRGSFYCHDGRAFMFDAGRVSPKGRLPAACRTAFDALTSGRGELCASCSGGTMWRTEGEAWRSVSPPKRLKDIPALSVTDDCMFVGAERFVWRSCRG